MFVFGLFLCRVRLNISHKSLQMNTLPPWGLTCGSLHLWSLVVWILTCSFNVYIKSDAYSSWNWATSWNILRASTVIKALSTTLNQTLVQAIFNNLLIFLISTQYVKSELHPKRICNHMIWNGTRWKWDICRKRHNLSNFLQTWWFSNFFSSSGQVFHKFWNFILVNSEPLGKTSVLSQSVYTRHQSPTKEKGNSLRTTVFKFGLELVESWLNYCGCPCGSWNWAMSYVCNSIAALWSYG